ncbi:polyprenyl synthetase family protein, partial [Salmonella enterica subsp. enterica serovar Muenchen]|nr:(2E,6E)-farnesyl diphosphate synthase [Salmonella enterica subsp. enterica serovar Reading]EIY7492291.1 polyprenyl synthetase family protein [Salmonella enterica subsp. enterica serovar Muenster]
MDFTQQLQACVTQANQALSRFIAPLPFQNTPVVEAMQYGALLGGKRLRPFLVYATGQMFGVSTATLDAPAAAVECIHAYSLIHDDLPAMDDDDLRRGLPTCHIKFGEANAILAGDALQTLAFAIISDAPMPEVADRDRIAMIA